MFGYVLIFMSSEAEADNFNQIKKISRGRRREEDGGDPCHHADDHFYFLRSTTQPRRTPSSRPLIDCMGAGSVDRSRRLARVLGRWSLVATTPLAQNESAIDDDHREAGARAAACVSCSCSVALPFWAGLASLCVASPPRCVSTTTFISRPPDRMH